MADMAACVYVYDEGDDVEVSISFTVQTKLKTDEAANNKHIESN